MHHKGMRVELYFPENEKHQHVLIEKWLFDAARWAGIPGGAIYRAHAGYGEHGELRDDGIFDTDRRHPMMACFITAPANAQKFLDYLAKEGLELFYTRSEVEYGRVGEHALRT
jgi:PII-like signaling protein